MVTYGFYDSLNHDRRYSAIQFSSIFDGIISDGVFMSYGDCFKVVPGEGMSVIVKTGRAWFDHTWTLNDTDKPIQLSESEVALDRMDAIVIDVNRDKRENKIVVVKGTPSSSLIRPTLIKDQNRRQYALAYIRVKPGATSIRTADITITVASETPLVTGLFDTISIESLVAQWKDEWEIFYQKQTTTIEKNNEFWEREWRGWYEAQTKEIQDSYLAWQSEWETWLSRYESEMSGTADDWRELWNAWFYTYTNQNQQEFVTWKGNLDAEFKTWFNSLQAMLEPDVAVNLANRITGLEACRDDVTDFMNKLENEQAVYPELNDNQNEPIIDSDGNEINARIIFAKETKVKDYQQVINVDSNNTFLLNVGDETKRILAKDLINSLTNIISSDDFYNNVAISSLSHEATSLKPNDFLIVENSLLAKKIKVSDFLYKTLDPWAPWYIRRMFFRSKSLGTFVTDEQWNEIHNGTFRDMFLGDYWYIGGHFWRIMDFNYWYGTGADTADTFCTKHHLVIMPDYNLYNAQMNSTNTTTGGYVGSEMYKYGLAEARGIINEAFGSEHILNHKEYLTNAVQNGKPFGGAFYDSKVELPSEIMCYGSLISSISYIPGSIVVDYKNINTNKLAAFDYFKPLLTIGKRNYWLRDVCGGEQFAAMVNNGAPVIAVASANFGVRPVFGIR